MFKSNNKFFFIRHDKVQGQMSRSVGWVILVLLPRNRTRLFMVIYCTRFLSEDGRQLKRNIIANNLTGAHGTAVGT